MRLEQQQILSVQAQISNLKNNQKIRSPADFFNRQNLYKIFRRISYLIWYTFKYY